MTEKFPHPRWGKSFAKLRNFYLQKTVFFRLVEEIKTLLPDFGRVLAIDSKAISSLAQGPNGNKDGKQEHDGRRDSDADFGKKKYRGQKKDGTW